MKNVQYRVSQCNYVKHSTFLNYETISLINENTLQKHDLLVLMKVIRTKIVNNFFYENHREQKFSHFRNQITLVF